MFQQLVGLDLWGAPFPVQKIPPRVDDFPSPSSKGTHFYLQETELTRSIFTVARLSGFVPGESPHNWLVMGEGIFRYQLTGGRYTYSHLSGISLPKNPLIFKHHLLGQKKDHP